MRVCLSERKFIQRIRELENLPADLTNDEINHNLPRYASHLFQHLREYGLNQVGLVGSSGSLGEFYVGFDACYDDTSRNTRIQGLAMLDPLSVTLEQHDLRAFFVGGVLTTMYDAFEDYKSEVTRVTVTELDAALPRIAQKLVFAPRPQAFQPVTEDDTVLLQGYEEEQFEQWCLRSGLKVPDRKVREIEAFNQREIAAAEAAKDARYEAFKRGNSE